MIKMKKTSMNEITVINSSGEYHIKVKPYDKKNWRNTKLLAVEFVLDIDNKTKTFKGLITEVE